MSKFVVGLTGGIGSGKTTIANMFAEYGVDLIDADIIARQVVAPNSAALSQISTHFGRSYLLADGNLNRSKLRNTVFADNNAKQWLNNLLHPLIRIALLEQIKKAKSYYCLLIAPLLIENNLTQYTDRVLVIDVSELTQINRTIQRDNIDKTQVKNIINSQITRDKRLLAADDVIDNNGPDLTLIAKQVKQLHQYYCRLNQ